MRWEGRWGKREGGPVGPPVRDKTSYRVITSKLFFEGTVKDGLLGVNFHVLDLATTAAHGDAHRGEEVAGAVRVVVHAPVEGGCHVLSKAQLDVPFTSRVLFDEVPNVVDDALDHDPLCALFRGGFLELVKSEGWELLDGAAPLETALCLVELLLLHVDLTLFDLVGGEGLEIGSETEKIANPDEPLCGVVLVKEDGIAVVLGELVVEVVVTFSKGDEGGDEVIARGVTVVKGGIAEVVSEAVDAKGGVVDGDETGDAGKEETTAPVAPAEAGNEGGEDEAHEESDENVKFVLELDDGVGLEVFNVGVTDTVIGAVDDHPSKVRKDEASMGAIGILVSVGPAMMGTVAAGPPLDGPLDGSTTDQGEENLEGKGGLIGTMGPETMVTGGDAHASGVIVNDSPDQGFCRELGGVDAVEGDQGSEDEQG